MFRLRTGFAAEEVRMCNDGKERTQSDRVVLTGQRRQVKLADLARSEMRLDRKLPPDTAINAGPA